VARRPVVTPSGARHLTDIFLGGLASPPTLAQPFSKAELRALPQALSAAADYLASPGAPLAVGAKGPAVKALQRALRKLGHEVGEVDGVFDRKLSNTLAVVQDARGASPTGTADHDTFRDLAKALTFLEKHPGHAIAGVRSDEVRKAESQLRRLGYRGGGRVDGLFTENTGLAIEALRADQAELLDRGRRLNDRVHTVLDRETAALRHDDYRVRVDDVKASRQLDAKVARKAAVVHPDGTVGLGEGSQGDVVAQVQRRLQRTGFDPQRTDGVFDERTSGALRAFQRSAGLEPTGRVDARTWNRLSQVFIYADGPTSPAQKVGEHSRAVKRTEALLEKKGFDPGAVDGVFDRQTQKAMKQFERKADLAVNGAVSTKDLEKLKAYNPPPKTDHRLTEVALDWARNPRFNPNNGRHDWNDYCQGFVNRVTDAAGHPNLVSWSPTAKDAYNVARAQGKTRTDFKNMPGNSVLYWDVRTNGHIAIATDKIGPDGKPMVLTTGSVLWFKTPGARLITWTQMLNTPHLGMPTAYSPAFKK
jgi:peptidoglycan hydrolase-like protein with peptidoglycan-binding domain